jgi:DNA polymerase-1
MVKPLTGTELIRQGTWSTDANTLPRLSAKGPARQILICLKERQTLEKFRGTYLESLRHKCALMEWKDQIIHGNFNQTIAVTGRLSSSGPNLQNLPEVMDQYMISRYS